MNYVYDIYLQSQQHQMQMHIVDVIQCTERFSAQLRNEILISECFHVCIHTWIRVAKHYSRDAAIISAASSRYLRCSTFAAILVVARGDAKDRAESVFVVCARYNDCFSKLLSAKYKPDLS